MTKINAKVVADSINPQKDRLTSVLVTMPRIILSEMNTHRMLSKNTSSSRAIPFNKMIESVQNNPFIPIAWQKDHKGMQGTEYHVGRKHENAVYEWLKARDYAVKQASMMNNDGITKQLCNRLLEPFMWTTVLITGGKEGWNNFFNLRCPQYEVPYTWDEVTKVFKSRKDATKYWQDKADIDPSIGKPKDRSDLEWLQFNKGQAEIHMMALAEKIYDAVNESTPKQLKAGEWHIPFGEGVNDGKLAETISPNKALIYSNTNLNELRVKIATARCARTSYTVVGEEGKESNYENDIKLHDRLVQSGHWSPFEHCAKVMSDREYEEIYTRNDGKGDGWCRNYKGFIQYREILENKT